MIQDAISSLQNNINHFKVILGIANLVYHTFDSTKYDSWFHKWNTFFVKELYLETENIFALEC